MDCNALEEKYQERLRAYGKESVIAHWELPATIGKIFEGLFNFRIYQAIPLGGVGVSCLVEKTWTLWGV